MRNPPPDKSCDYCGKQFTPTSRPSRNRAPQRFCSRVCGMHHARPIKPRSVCSIDECERFVNARGFCHDHYRRWRSYGDPLHKREHRERTTTGGYREVFVPDLGKAVLVHRLVMADLLGRDLHPNENVHHINGDRTDNRAENLELWVKAQPSGQRVVDRVADAQALLRRYAPELLAESRLPFG